MPIGIAIAVTICIYHTRSGHQPLCDGFNLKKNAESKIGNADSKAREIIDDAVKTN